MDFGRLNRKELQALCKQHNIPANKTNAFMAEALGAKLNAPPESELSTEYNPDPAELVRSKANQNRPSRSRKVGEVESCDLDNLASQLAESNLAAVSDYIMVEADGQDIDEAVVEPLIEDSTVLQRESEVASEQAKVARKSRTQLAKASTKSLSTLVDVIPALVEPTLEISPQAKSNNFPLASASPKITSEHPTSAGRVPKVTRQAPSEVTLKLGSAKLDSVPLPDDVSLANLSPADIVGQETAGLAKPKKGKAKMKTAKRVKPVSPISVHILEGATVPQIADKASATMLDMLESPTLALTSNVISPEEIIRAASMSPAPWDEAFEFHPVPESFTEIMTLAKPLVEATKECHHRLGRKTGKACKSCAPVEKVVSLMQEVVQTIEVPADDVSRPEADCLTTPLKEGNDKENALKIIDGHDLSIRKLQREIKGRGLSKRNNTMIVRTVK